MDLEVVVNSILGGQVGSYKERRLLHEIQSLMERDWEFRASHVYKEANRCAQMY